MKKVLNKKTDQIPEGAMYCGRPSILGNPFVIGKDGDRADVIAMYEIFLYMSLEDREFLVALMNASKATALVCWCAPEPCHCDVIAEFLSKLPRSELTAQPRGSEHQKGMGEVPEANQVSAPAERRDHSVPSPETL